MGGGKKIERKKVERKRVRDFGTVPGVMRTGSKNKITDVPGVLTGHKIVRSGDGRTGVMVIVLGPGSMFDRKFIVARYMHNGFDKTCGLVQVKELGALEVPIALTNTPNTGLVADALVGYITRQCAKGRVGVTPVSPVVGGCNNYKVNRTQHRAVSIEDAMEAFFRADEDFEEGDVGVGTGTVCCGLKGGIGSVSRIIRIGGKKYTLGILVQFSLGTTEDPAIDGTRVGERILEGEERCRKMTATEQDQGSIMTIVTADLSVSDCQLKCTIHRAGVGIVRTGAYIGHDGGEVMTGFTIAGRLQGEDSPEIMTNTCVREGLINVAFKVIAGAVHEAILNPTTIARRIGGLAGEMYRSLSEFLPRIPKH